MNKYEKPENGAEDQTISNMDEVMALYIEAVLGDAYAGQSVDDLTDDQRLAVVRLIAGGEGE